MIVSWWKPWSGGGKDGSNVGVALEVVTQFQYWLMH